MKKFLLLFFITVSVTLHAQQTKTDTVVQGYYIPLDLNVVSCKVSIISGNTSSDTTLTGNKIPLNFISKICSSQKGTVVVYYEITINQNGVLTKAPSVRYIIESKNTKAVLTDPTLPTLISAKDLAGIEIDTSFISFRLDIISGGYYSERTVTGNKFDEMTKMTIRSLKPGSKVFFSQIIARNKEGKEVKLPAVAYRIQ